MLLLILVTASLVNANPTPKIFRGKRSLIGHNQPSAPSPSHDHKPHDHKQLATECGIQVDGTSRNMPGLATCLPCTTGTFAGNGQANCAACHTCPGDITMACTTTMDTICQSDGKTGDTDLTKDTVTTAGTTTDSTTDATPNDKIDDATDLTKDPVTTAGTTTEDTTDATQDKDNTNTEIDGTTDDTNDDTTKSICITSNDCPNVSVNVHIKLANIMYAGKDCGYDCLEQKCVMWCNSATPPSTGGTFCGIGTIWNVHLQQCTATYDGIMQACKDERKEWGFTCETLVTCEANPAPAPSSHSPTPL